MSKYYPHPRTILVELSESTTSGSTYAIRYEALRLAELDVPNWPDCHQPRHRALRRIAVDRQAPSKYRLAAIKALCWGLSLGEQERQTSELKALKEEAAATGKRRPYTRTAKWYSQHGLPEQAG